MPITACFFACSNTKLWFVYYYTLSTVIHTYSNSKLDECASKLVNGNHVAGRINKYSVTSIPIMRGYTQSWEVNGSQGTKYRTESWDKRFMTQSKSISNVRWCWRGLNTLFYRTQCACWNQRKTERRSNQQHTSFMGVSSRITWRRKICTVDIMDQERGTRIQD